VKSRMRGWLEELGDVFWLRPALLVAMGMGLGAAMTWAERMGLTESLASGGLIYSGGEAGARSLLSAVASSSIGVAGTVFSITVAALSLAAGQMGPRLLRNFTRDPGNQIVLGTFLGTFAYALVLLRTVRSVQEGAFVPHLGVTGALVLALLCVAALVWFVHHIANSINVDTVIGLVHAELLAAIASLETGTDTPSSTPPRAKGMPVRFGGNGYLRSLDEKALADWAVSCGVVLRLRVRPGDYLFPGAIVAEVEVGNNPEQLFDKRSSADEAFASAVSIGDRQAAAQDLEFAVRQLVEVAVRALSPGINDPFTAMAVLERLGATLCAVADRRLPDPVLRRNGREVLVRKVPDYDGLCDTMFHMIRQNSGGSAAVLIRLVETLQRVEEVERDPRRLATLRRHADWALGVRRCAISLESQTLRTASLQSPSLGRNSSRSEMRSQRRRLLAERGALHDVSTASATRSLWARPASGRLSRLLRSSSNRWGLQQNDNALWL
jgi:uncharacterized membrane protein